MNLSKPQAKARAQGVENIGKKIDRLKNGPTESNNSPNSQQETKGIACHHRHRATSCPNPRKSKTPVQRQRPGHH